MASGDLYMVKWPAFPYYVTLSCHCTRYIANTDNGDEYEGEWKNDKKHGKGIYRMVVK